MYSRIKRWTDFMNELFEDSEDGGFAFMEMDSKGTWLIERDGGGPEPVTDPDLSAALHERFAIRRKPWPGRV